MRTATTTDTTTSQPQGPDLIIDVCPMWVLFEGTAAQLQAEGLIPEGFEWPRAADEKRWRIKGLEYLLSRTRPQWHKGPKSSWAELDNWSLRTMAENYDWETIRRRGIERKAEALRREIHRLTPAGQREHQVFEGRLWAASQDKVFQDFKAMFVPARKKPGRKAKPAPAQGVQQ
ncbi:MAG: hypothetical protein CVU21_22335 [Betaproteobacteria bacterium HGW-Betaproteobacteria-15]|nr:MAG: hypothetical protein CVU21_22335 [Betaproteobacteria bacterium HGW-Betaproteobacteria-15]